MLSIEKIVEAIRNTVSGNSEYVTTTISLITSYLKLTERLRLNTKVVREAILRFAKENNYTVVIIRGTRHKRKIYFFKNPNHPLIKLLAQRGSFLSIYVQRNGKYVHIHSNKPGQKGIEI